MKKLHPELVAYLDTHRDCVSAHRAQLHAKLPDIAAISGSGRQIAIDLQGKLHLAELTASANGAMRHRLNHMHTRLANFEQRASAFYTAARELAVAALELENGYAMDVETLERILELNGDDVAELGEHSAHSGADHAAAESTGAPQPDSVS